MYRDLRQHYWWTGMKPDIVEFVAQCLNCQQVKLTKSAHFILVKITYDAEKLAKVYIRERYHSDSSYIIHWDSVLLDENLSYEEKPVAILDRDVHKLRSKEIAYVKVQRKNRPVKEANWET
ncbi:uncharacterized protein LOC132047568 [Lycium ferocissimum]|uniref:uncharacterized protein LOC132047568 n=1 Tax=Lycium ferocissimum TaxID=112874 RepID=UPI002815C4C9|nr:uncharacterized protein LOC132047568 [Lycium ferocissimum]